MRPFTVLIGIVLGSAASITFGLGTVLIVFCILAGEHPDWCANCRSWPASLLAFGHLTAASAGSFLGQAKASVARLGACGHFRCLAAWS
jgi:hypothetical protein